MPDTVFGKNTQALKPRRQIASMRVCAKSTIPSESNKTVTVGPGSLFQLLLHSVQSLLSVSHFSGKAEVVILLFLLGSAPPLAHKHAVLHFSLH